MAAILQMYVIYRSPLDYPGSFVVRVHDVPGGPHKDCEVCNSLEEARKQIPFGLIRIARWDDDEPHIVETWM